MGKKDKKKNDSVSVKPLKKKQLKALDRATTKSCKTKCCEKYKKKESKRCSKCPCFDLLARVA